MNTVRILTQAQAQAVYSAMCALNDVDGNFSLVEFEDSRVGVFSNGSVQTANKWGQFEHHTNQTTFAAAYGLA